MLAFSFTVPFTRLAIGGLSPLFVGSGRAVIAALLAAAALAATRRSRSAAGPTARSAARSTARSAAGPTGRQWLRLAIVGGGVVVGFPLLTSYALTSAPASHGAVVIALLPATTAVLVAVRSRERPPRAFWIAAFAGACAAVIFALAGSAPANAASGAGGAAPGSGGTGADLLFFGAVLAAAIGYAEGGVLARELGAWQTVSWALVLCSPLMVLLTVVAAIRHPPHATAGQWAAFAYLGVVSMFLGFFAWYRGLAIGPMAQVSQVQLAQPVLTIGWAVLLLHEPLTPATAFGAVAVILCATVAVRTRAGRHPGRTPVPSHAGPARLRLMSRHARRR